MNCPFCGGPMEKGHLDNGRRDLGLMWFPETRKIPIYEICTKRKALLYAPPYNDFHRL